MIRLVAYPRGYFIAGLPVAIQPSKDFFWYLLGMTWSRQS